MQLLAALGGLVNRNSARLFVSATTSDSEWLTYLRSEGQWLESADFLYESSLDNLVNKFASEIRGVVLYDPNVPSSSNIASTLSGMEDLLPVLSGGTLYSQLCENGPQLKVTRSLVDLFDGSLTGSKKNDAYEWFRNHFMLEENRTTTFNPAIHGYFMVNFFFLHIINMAIVIAHLFFRSHIMGDIVRNSNRITGGRAVHLTVPTN
jgi:hypothetical protein